MTTKAKKRKSTKGRVGSSFESFLTEQGTLSETRATAIKRVIAFQLATAMQEDDISKTALARRMDTSRSQIDRILDPEK